MSLKDKSFSKFMFYFWVQDQISTCVKKSELLLRVGEYQQCSNSQALVLCDVKSSHLCDGRGHSKETWLSGWSRVGNVWKEVVFFFPFSVIKYLRAVIYAFVATLLLGFPSPVHSLFIHLSHPPSIGVLPVKSSLDGNSLPSLSAL